MESDVKMIPILSYNPFIKKDIREHENLILNPLPILKDNNLKPELIELFKSNGLNIDKDNIKFSYIITEDELEFNIGEDSLPIYKGELEEYLNNKGVLEFVKSVNKLIGKENYTNVNIIDNLEDLLKGEFFNDNSKLTDNYIIPSDKLMEMDNPCIFTYYYFEVTDSYGNTYTLINDKFNKEQSKLIDTLININKIKTNELNLSKSALYIYNLLEEYGYNNLFNIYVVDIDTNKIINSDENVIHQRILVNNDLDDEFIGKEKLISTILTTEVGKEYPSLGFKDYEVLSNFLYKTFYYTLSDNEYKSKMFYKFPIIDFKVFYNIGVPNNNLLDLSMYYNNNIYLKYAQSNFTNTDNTLYEMNRVLGVLQLPKPFDYSRYVGDYGKYTRYSELNKVTPFNSNLDLFYIGNEFINGIIIGEDFVSDLPMSLGEYIKDEINPYYKKVYQEVEINIGNLNWEEKPITIPMLKEFTKDNPYTMSVKMFYH